MAGNFQIPTPEEYVIHMLDYIGYNSDIYGKSVLENSCGTGNILLEMVTRYIKNAQKEKIDVRDIEIGLSRDFYAYEIDEECVKVCKRRLNNLLHAFGLNKIRWNIECKDFLGETIEHKFDYIVGNPPYITYHDMSDEQKELLKTKYKTCRQGRSDYYYAFMEASINVLSQEGKMAYLVPYSIMKNKSARELRRYLLPYITEIYDYRTIKIFPETIISSLVIQCENRRNVERFRYCLIAEQKVLNISKQSLGKEWIILGEQNGSGKKFGDYFEVMNSVATLLNEAFILREYKIIDQYYVIGEYKIEKELVKNAVSTKSIIKKGKCKDKIIFPYKIVNGEKRDYTEEEFESLFPYATEYLRQYAAKLRERKADKKALWFQYGRSQAVAHVWGEKLIIPMVITKRITVYKAGTDEIPYAGYFIKKRANSDVSLIEAKRILESEAFYKYVKMCGTPTTPTSYRISVNDIKDYML